MLEKINFWLWKHKKSSKSALKFYLSIYDGINGFELSKTDRSSLGDSFEMVYGEIDFYTLAQLLRNIHPSESDVFYDLGCGTGKAVIIANLLYPLKKSYGIELLPSLYQTCLSSLKKLKSENDKNIHFIQDDFFNIGFKEATIIYLTGTGFFGERKTKLIDKLKECNSGCWVIIVSKQLPETDFTLYFRNFLPMSWGTALISMYRRK